MIVLAYVLSGLAFLMSLLFLVQVQVPSDAPPFLWIGKLLAGALSALWAVLGAVGAVIGWTYQSYWAIPFGLIGTGMMIRYIWACTRDHKGFETVFGPGWKDKILPQQARNLLKRRWTPFLRMKAPPEPLWERDVPFYAFPDSDQQLLCDIWRPADGSVSGLAIIYFHGGSWTAMDKDFGTRPMFQHLTAQGHTIMDVRYRLCPEVDYKGMMDDVKRAVAWMKTNASHYGVNPNKIVLAGGSTGGHLAMLAGYAPNHPELTPDDLHGTDLSACGIVSYFGPSDVLVGYSHWNVKQRADKLPAVPIGTKLEPQKAFLYGGRLDIFLGGHPEDIPEIYQLASPITHVNPGSPPTLLIQGDKDLLVPLDTTRALYDKLLASGVPAISVVFPWTEHIFDLLLPQVSPAAQSALYDVERFLALLSNRN